MSLDQPINSSSTEDAATHLSTPPSSSLPDDKTTTTAPNSPKAMTMTSSAPELGEGRQNYATTLAQSSSLDVAMLLAARSGSDPSPNILTPPESGSCAASPTETDPQIIEALRSKDRLWVLKLGEMMENLITERKQPRIDLTPATTYQRMLVHRCSAYYKLAPETDSVTKAISVYYRMESRIPPRRISDLVPAEESAQPAFKIMRRAVPERRGRSQPESVAGDEGEGSDVEASEAGSIGGRSAVTGGSKRHLTIEEREAAYNEARSRIFMGFEEKDKDKEAEKGSSANSSSISLVSGSGSASAGQSSAGDVDDSVSSAATESEWSGPVTRDRRDRRRVGSGSSAPRSVRGTSYTPASGSNSSRHSRAASPSSFTYPSLYDPSGNSYDPGYTAQPPSQGYIQYYYPPYPPPQPAAAPSAVPGYSYPYQPYSYPPPPQHSDPTSPNELPYPHPQQPQHLGYPPQTPYGWVPPHQPPPSQSAPPVTSPAPMNHNVPGVPQAATHPSTPQGQLPYPGYFPQPYPPYPMPGYYGQAPYPPPPIGTMQPPPPVPTYYPDGPHADSRFNANGFDSNEHSRAASRNSNGHGRKHGGTRKQGWNSYGPGMGGPGSQFGPPGGNEIMGPRLISRRTSLSSQSNGNRTPGDETSSVTSSSTTSSTSQRTFTSTSSKHHPLPARPDWAVGLKAQPTLSSARHHDHSNPNSRTMSPARFGGNLPLLGNQRNPQHLPPQHPPQPTDFPPLSSAPEKRTPVIGGAWTNPSSIKSVLRPGPAGSTNGPERNNVLVHYPTTSPNSNSAMRLQDDQESTFERPPPKSNAELYNPKGGRKQPVYTSGFSVDQANGRGSVVGAGADVDVQSLAEQVGGLNIGQSVEGAQNAFSVPTHSTMTAGVPANES